MSFIHPLILAGMCLMIIPIIIHFLLKSKPKRIIFPALRLIKERQIPNSSRMRIKHLWLLILRMLVIGFIVFAIARPTLPAANYWLNMLESGILAGIICVSGVLYYLLQRQFQSSALPPYVINAKRDWLRTWIIAITSLVILLGVGLPYQYRVRGEIFNPGKVSLELPVSTVMIFDSSLSMSYKYEGKTRLEVARQLALKHVTNLPGDSKIAITDTSQREEILFQADLAAAQQRLEKPDGIIPHVKSLPLNQRILAAIELQKKHRAEIIPSAAANTAGEVPDRYIREVFIFTDLAATAWDEDSASRVKEELKAVPWLNIYVIDVGADNSCNVAITECRLSSEVATSGVPLSVDVVVEASHPVESKVKLELLLQDDQAPQVKVGEQEINLQHGESTSVSFSLKTKAKTWAKAVVQLVASDPLEFDNKRDLVLKVTNPTQLLVVGDTLRDNVEWVQALAPDELVRQDRSNYKVTSITLAELSKFELDEYEAISLLNIPRIDQATSNKISKFVEQGGVIFLSLGNPKISSPNFQNLVWLPANPLVHTRMEPPGFLDFIPDAHPIIKRYDSFGMIPVLSTIDVRRFWKTKPKDGCRILANFSDPDHSPALILLSFGKGHVVQWNSGVDLIDGAYAKNWSDLPRAGWAFIAFADQMFQTLLGRYDERFNYQTSEGIYLALPNQNDPTFLLRFPDLKQQRIKLPFETGDLKIQGVSGTIANSSPLQVKEMHDLSTGTYELVTDNDQQQILEAFSINHTPGESRMKRLTTENLNNLFDEKRYELSQTIEQLSRQVTQGRIGREVYSLALFLCIIIFCGEHFVANNFYQQEAGKVNPQKS